MMLSITQRMVHYVLLGLLLQIPLARAADKSCAAVNKAGELGLKQARIHHAVDLLRPVAPKPGAKLSPMGEGMMQMITIDKAHYMALDGRSFSTKTLKDAEERMLMSGLAAFAAIDEGCRLVGKATVAGITTDVYEQGSNKSPDTSYYKFWIDSKTGLPLKGLEDAADRQVASFKATKDERPKIDVKTSQTNRILNTSAFVYGDVVKPPKLTGAKDLMGQKGEADAAALAILKSILMSP